MHQHKKNHSNPFSIAFKTLWNVKIKTTSDLNALSQPPQQNQNKRLCFGTWWAEIFFGLYLTTLTIGSLFLAITLIENKRDIQEIYNAALIEDLTKDKIYLAEQYGISPDQERRRKNYQNRTGNQQKIPPCLGACDARRVAFLICLTHLDFPQNWIKNLRQNTFQPGHSRLGEFQSIIEQQLRQKNWKNNVLLI